MHTPSSSSANTTGAGEFTVPPHGLRWAIKYSFLGYVARMPDGQAYLGAGVGVTEQNELVFPLDEEETRVPGVFAFGGDVRFAGHYGMLFVPIARPRVEVHAGRAEMTIADPASKDGGARLRLVEFDLAEPEHDGDLERRDATDVRLAAEAVELFGDVYQAGEPFEPLAITVPTRGGGHG